MGKLIKLVVVGAVLFGISASASFLLRPPVEVDEAAETAEPTVKEQTQPEAKSTMETTNVGYQSKGLTAEVVLRLRESIRAMETDLLAREIKVGKREERVRFMLNDLKRERQEISAMLELAEKRAAESRAMLEEAHQLEESGLSSAPTENSSDSTQANTASPSSVEDDENLEVIAEWLKAMPAEQSSETIKVMCNDGKMEMVVKVISFLESRDVAKILGAVGDPVLVAEIMRRYRQLNAGL